MMKGDERISVLWLVDRKHRRSDFIGLFQLLVSC